jgi:hypothetical protein
MTSWEAADGEVAGLVMFLLLASYMVWDTMRAKEE